jgi:uncharacterized protein YdeI (YjbR/CyaY-like superfamily)
MPTKDPRVDAYIAKAPEFAKPILIHLRTLAHQACPSVEETLKWRMPHFSHKGILFGMAAFKQHCAVHFWKGSLILGDNLRKGGFGNLGKVTALSELPGKATLLRFIKKAVELNEGGVKKSVTKTERKRLVVPAYFRDALSKNKKAQTTFDNFSYSHKKEYVTWITEAKREETRQKRIKTALAWMAQGKPQNWKYMNC